jgi:hypothetical protein
MNVLLCHTRRYKKNKLTRAAALSVPPPPHQKATHSLIPIKLDYYDPMAVADSLHVSFRGCHFTDNAYAGLPPAQPALIVATGSQNRLTIAYSRFEQNDFWVVNDHEDNDDDSHDRTLSSSLIESQGPVNLFRNCFVNNRVGVALVVVFGGGRHAAVTAQDNYYYDDNNDRRQLCPLAATFATSLAYETLVPICTVADAEECRIDSSSSSDTPSTISGRPTTSPATITPPSPTTTTTTATMPNLISSPSSSQNDSVRESQEEITASSSSSSIPGGTKNGGVIVPAVGLSIWIIMTVVSSI